MALLAQLRKHGLQLTPQGEVLLVEPRAALTDELRALIRANKPAILRELAQESHEAPADLRSHFAPALLCGRLVACVACIHFRSRPGERPDGWCASFYTETWGCVPFQCTGYVERRQ